MDNREYPKVRAEAIEQGWTVRPTRQGEMFLAPDGSSAFTWHTAYRSSDPNALRSHVRAMARTEQFKWLPPKRKPKG